MRLIQIRKAWEKLPPNISPARPRDPDDVISGDRRSRNEPEVKDRTIRIPLNKLIECNWNLANRLGTYCREKFNFQKIDKIKEAYESVWPKSFHRRIHAIFDQELKEAAAIRNAIIHSGGRPDDKFRWQVGAIAPCITCRVTGISPSTAHGSINSPT